MADRVLSPFDDNWGGESAFITSDQPASTLPPDPDAVTSSSLSSDSPVVVSVANDGGITEENSSRYLCGCPSCQSAGQASGVQWAAAPIEGGDGGDSPQGAPLPQAGPPVGTAYYIAALMNSDDSTQDGSNPANPGGYWSNGRFAPSGEATFGNAAVVTYSFTTALPDQ